LSSICGKKACEEENEAHEKKKGRKKGEKGVRSTPKGATASFAVRPRRREEDVLSLSEVLHR